MVRGEDLEETRLFVREIGQTKRPQLGAGGDNVTNVFGRPHDDRLGKCLNQLEYILVPLQPPFLVTHVEQYDFFHMRCQSAFSFDRSREVAESRRRGEERLGIQQLGRQCVPRMAHMSGPQQDPEFLGGLV